MSKLPRPYDLPIFSVYTATSLRNRAEGTGYTGWVRCNIVSLTSVDPRSSASRARLALHSLFEACIGDAARLGLFYRNGELPLIK